MRRLVAVLLGVVLFLAGLSLGLTVRAAAPRSAPDSMTTLDLGAGDPERQERAGVPVLPGTRMLGTLPAAGPSRSPQPAVAVSPRPVATRPPVRPTSRPAHATTGTASWGDGWSGVVTRLPRGTRICVTGPLGRWCGASVGYGPAVWTGRIADLSRAVFADICGDPSRGLCTVTLAVLR